MLVTQKIANLLNGVSQRPPTQRFPSQAEEQINGLSSMARGVMQRPPSEHVGVLTSDVTGWDDAFVHPINRDADERYHVVIADGEVSVFDALLATPVTVLAPQGQAYLTDAANKGYRAVTIGDTTVIVNRGKTVTRGTTKTAAPVFEALVFVRQADFSTNYAISLNSAEVAIRTVDQSTSESRLSISTDAITSDLMAVLNAEDLLTDFTFTQLGSTIHIVRSDGDDFTLSVSDGLADQGLKAVKGSVQSFEDLPARALDGFVVEITGTPENPFDNYFVQYDDNDTPEEDGVWRECPKPGTLIDLNETTMPHRLTRQGNIVENVEHVGLPSTLASIVPLPESSLVTSFDWTHRTPGDTPIGAGFTVRLTEHENGVKKTLAADGASFQVRYGIDVSRLEPGVIAWVRIYKNSALMAERPYRSGEIKNRLLLTPLIIGLKVFPDDPDSDVSRPTSLEEIRVVNSAVVSTDVIEVKLEYSTDASPDEFRRATLSFQPQSLQVYGTNTKRITLLTPVYPAGATVQIELNANTFSHVVGAVDESAVTVGAALATLIDAHADWIVVANSPGNVIDVKRADSADFTVNVPSIFDEDTTFHNDTLALVVNEHVGRTIRNLTDGSSGEVTANTATTITVAALAGGADNRFQVGDVCSIIGAGQYFVFEPCPWNDRIAGDLTVNPFPSFVDKTISEVFFHENRLGFLSGENVVLSSSGDLFNFFRYTATDLRADDAIDVRSANERVTVFHSAVSWNKKLTLWSENAQFELSGEPALTPTTVRLDLMGSYPNAPDPRPLVVGDRLFFTRGKSGHTQVFEFVGETETTPAKAIDLTKDIPTYIEGAPLEMVGDADEGFLALLTDANDQENLYVYSFLYDGDTKVISSWSRWEFAPGTRIVGLDMVDGVLGFVHKHTADACLDTIDLDLTPDPAEKVAYLDRRLASAAAVYAAGTDTTTWTLPYSVAVNGSEGVVSVTNRTTKEVYGVTRPSPTTVAVTGEGDLSAASVYVGIKFFYTYTLSTIYLRNDRSIPETRGRLQIRYLDVFYQDTTDFTVTVTPSGRTAIIYVVALSSPDSDKLHIPVLCRNEEVTISITNTTPGPCAFSEVDWEGYYVNRSRRL